MTYKELFKQIKEQQKILASRLTELKRSRKQDKRNGRSLWNIEDDIWHLKNDFRHRHITYCEMRGRTRDQIERPREDNPASQSWIDDLKKRWMEQIDEDVRSCAA